MSQEAGNLQLIEQAIQQVRIDLGGDLADAITSILTTNNQRGRIEQYKRLCPRGTVQTYVFQVAHNFEKDHSYLDLIQKQKNSEAWKPLLDKIQAWAYSFLDRWHLDTSTRSTLTHEIAQETGPEIIRSHFPYDSEFDPWACKITHHVCSKYMQRYSSSRVVDTIDLSEADEWFQDSDKSPDSNMEDEFATRQFLLDAIVQLSEKQKFVIWQLYFEGWSIPQIASHAQVKKNVIYKRHFDALEKLRKILGEN